MTKRSWTEAYTKVRSEGKCRVCRALTELDPAHVLPRSIGGGDSYLSTVPLCRTCHTAYDRPPPGQTRLDLLPFLTYEEQAEAVRVVGIERARRRLGGER